MTYKLLCEILDKNNTPEDVYLVYDSGWECDATEMNGIFYNKEKNEIIFTQSSAWSEYLSKPGYVKFN